MSELALTKTVVEGALSRIQRAIEEEEKLKEGVQQDLEFITGEFQMMQSFLKVANKERAKKNEVMRTWVRQLRDLAFDVEDWVEFVAHLDKDKSWCSCWWRLVPSWAVPRCLAPPWDLDEATAEMKLLKARVHDVSQRNTRYNLIFSRDDSCSSSGLDSKAIVPTGSDLSSTAFQILRQVWRDETDRLRNVGSLQKLITSEVVGDDLQVIWLWESDDRYASQLIHMAYKDEEICRSFKLCAWVKIMHPFNLQAFLNTLAAQLLSMGSCHPQATSDGLTSTAELIQQATKEQRYLVVLEQVSDLVEWNIIRKYLRDNNKGSRIVVSTQNLQRAILCTRMPYLVSELGWFSDGRPSICAFYQKAAGQSDSDMDTLIGKIKYGSVISVYGRGPRKSSVVKRSYLSIQQNPGKLQGVGFQTFKWVPVVVGRPFKLVDFSRRVHLVLDVYGFYDGGLKELFDIFGGTIFEEVLFKRNEEELIESSRELLNENCLIVIDGLRSKKDWDDVRTILPAEPSKCCVIVVTDEERLARYCVDDNKDLLVQVSMELDDIPCRRQMNIEWMISISDRHLSKRRLLYDELINDCIAVRRPPVASVWGIAGVGKSTLVNWSYNKKMLDPENIEHRFSFYCWVDVPHPFSLAELSLRLLESFFLDYHSEGKEIAMIGILEGDRDPIQECRLLLKQHHGWLLVLDGLWSTDDWDSINKAFCLSQPRPGCNTIVVTNEQHVAMHCANNNDEQVISVQGLEADEALKFFKEKIRKKNINERVSELSKIIMAKCGGLPKVIDAVASHYKNMFFDEQTYSKLKDINDNFMHILEGLHSLRGLFSWMEHYLETCKDYLKPCIFYLPVFPMGHNIRSRRLKMRWLAEGYINDTSGRTLQEHTNRLNSEIREFSMFQWQPSSKPAKYQVNGFLHEYINSRPMEDNFVFALEGSCSMRSQRAGAQHLTIRDNWKRDINVFGSTDFSRLRPFTVFGECRPWMFDPEKIKMKYVRVLDLEDASGVTNDDLKNIVEVFPRLKFLSLRGCRNITSLPKSLGRLRQLQSLDIRHTPVATLPEAILKLQKLQYVRAGTIHSAPWDEGGIMVPYQTATTGEIISPSVTEEDGSTFAAAASAPAEDASTPSEAASQSEDSTIFETPPLSPAEVALLAQTEDGKTVAAAQLSPEEEATAGRTPDSSALEEDSTIVAAYPTIPTQGATILPVPPSTLTEEATIVAPTLSIAAEDTTSLAADPKAAVALVASTPAEHASTPSATASDSKDTTITETSPLSPTAQADTSSTAPAAPRSRSHALVPSLLSKLCCRSQSRLDNTNHGVEVPAGIGKLTTLHTFGVANVGPGNNSVILKELHKLTLLWRISVCGINPDNIHQFFDAIKGLDHLGQLTVRLDKNKDGLIPSLDETIARPPKSLDECLKLLGHVRILPGSWIKEFADVDILDLEVTLQEQDDMQVILDHLIHRNQPMERLCIKPIQDGELRMGIIDESKIVRLRLFVLEIVCSTKLQATIGNIGAVDFLRVECSTGSSLELSGLQAIRCLQEVWLKDSCSDTLKQNLQGQLDQRQDNDKPVLKVLQRRSS